MGMSEHIERIGLIGFGDFGRFAVEHLSRYTDILIHDSQPVGLDPALRARVVPLAEAASAQIVILAVPVQALRDVLTDLVPHLRPGTLVIDVCSVKVGPVALLSSLVPPGCQIVSTHPLFGPQSGRNGIAGMRVAVLPVRGTAHRRVAAFLRRLGLKVLWTTAERHDAEMACVQALTHMIARVVGIMALPEVRLKTMTYELMEEMVSLVGTDSDALFDAILTENPYAARQVTAFFSSIDKMRDRIDRRSATPPMESRYDVV